MNDELTLRKHHARFRALLNISYYEKAERFYSRISSMTVFFSIVLSSTAFAALGDVLPIPATSQVATGSVFSCIVALLNAIVLAFGIQDKANDALYMRKRWLELHGSISSMHLDTLEDEAANERLSAIEKIENDLHAADRNVRKRWQKSAFEEARQAIYEENQTATQQ